MAPSTTSPTRSSLAANRPGRVRLRRAALMGGPAVLAAAALVVLTAQGAIAAQFSISGMPFAVTAQQLQGQGFEQYGGLDSMIPNSPNAGSTGGQVLVIVSAIRQATLTHLCQSVDLGGTNLVIHAGNGTPVTATNLVTDSDQISGDAAFSNIEIGNDASTLDKANAKGPAGVFGQQADTVTINNLRQNNYATTAASFKLPGLSMGFGSQGC